jgi:hypothetical protein
MNYSQAVAFWWPPLPHCQDNADRHRGRANLRSCCGNRLFPVATAPHQRDHPRIARLAERSIGKPYDMRRTRIPTARDATPARNGPARAAAGRETASHGVTTPLIMIARHEGGSLPGPSQ